MAERCAFYDLDGTLVASNVVNQYAWYARRDGSRVRLAKLIAGAPAFLVLDLYSRRTFNVVFFRHYRGFRRKWLEEMATGLFHEVFQPHMYPGAKKLVELDRAQGFRTVLVTGSPDFALGPLVEHFGFDDVVANRVVFRDGVATGELEPPLLAEDEKVAAIREMCRKYNVDSRNAKAYSDSLSDLPMLEAVGAPAVVHPGLRLRAIAKRRMWPILNLKQRK